MTSGAWAQARSLAHVGELTARWLEGRITHQPGYCDPEPGEEPGPDPETEPIRHLLAACCRAGYVTTGSQPGTAGPAAGVPGQRAAVEGLCDAAAWASLGPLARGAGLIVIAHDPSSPARRTRADGRCCRWCARRPGAVPVTRLDGRDVTWFGARRTRRDLRDVHVGFGECHPDAVREVCAAVQVILVEREWGRNEVLFPLLERWAASVMAGAGAP